MVHSVCSQLIEYHFEKNSMALNGVLFHVKSIIYIIRQLSLSAGSTERLLIHICVKGLQPQVTVSGDV